MRVRRLVALAGLLSVTIPSAARAAPVTDCPLRDAPFSTDLPIVDLLLSPAAKALVEAQAGDLLRTLPPRFYATQAPTFAAILTLKELARIKPSAKADLPAIDAALRRLPVTAADRTARCVRYDNDRAPFTLPAGKPRLLLFEKMTGYRDGPSVDAARAAFQAMAQRMGWALAVTDKGGAFTSATLRRFDAVIWNNVSGDVLTLSQRRAFRRYLERGGGFIGIHGSAGDPVTFWDWYADILIGARFAGHTLKPQFQQARVVTEDRAAPFTAGLPDAWPMQDEWYSFHTSPRASGSDIVTTLDEGSYSPVGVDGVSLRMNDHPIAWTHCIGRGRMFYSAIGHLPETYADPHHIRMLENAVAAVTAQGDCRADRQTSPVR